jgi:hypothetical protein
MKTIRLARRRESGVLLLMVALVLGTLAALSFGLIRAVGTVAAPILDDYNNRAAGYLAEAALAAAKWTNEAGGCTTASIPWTSLGTGSFKADVTGKAKQRNIVASGFIGTDTLRLINKANVALVNFNKTETKELGGDVLDTSIDKLALPLFNGNLSDLALYSDEAYGLLYWSIKDVPADSLVMSATLTMTQNGPSGSMRQVALLRMMTTWDQSATWSRPSGLMSSWTGKDFGVKPVATTYVNGTGTASWDVTSLVDGWNSGRLANYGMMLTLLTPNQSIKFYSREAAAARRPILRVTFAKAC